MCGDGGCFFVHVCLYSSSKGCRYSSTKINLSQEKHVIFLGSFCDTCILCTHYIFYEMDIHNNPL